MNRHPWWTRAGLLAVVNAGAGVMLALGFGTELVGEIEAIAVAVIALLADLEIVGRGEDKTTPLDDPVGRDGLPLVSWAQVEQMMAGRAPGEACPLSDAELDALPSDDDEPPNGHAHGERGAQ